MAPADEAFWREQEARHRKLEQPCCTQSNMSWSLVDMPGDFAVVIHGEADCLNCFFHHLGRNIHSYYSTRLSERQLVAGDTDKPLRHLLELIVRERSPAAVFVLGTCPVELVGDPFERVVMDVARESGVPMRALRTHGLALMSQARCQDWLYAELAGLPQVERQGSRQRALNIVGLPRGADLTEVEQLLSKLGLELNGSFPGGADLPRWQSVSHAVASFVVDRGMFPRLVEKLEQQGQQVAEVPLPVGLEPTARFYRTIADAFGQGAAMAAALEPLLEARRAELAALGARVKGRRLAVCVRMLKTHRTDRLAYDGLGDLPLLRSLGFDLSIFVQGPPEARVRERFAERLRELGHGDVPFDVFEGPWKLGERLSQGEFEIALMSDVARNVVERAGVRMLSAGTFRPLLAGMTENLTLIARAVDGLP